MTMQGWISADDSMAYSYIRCDREQLFLLPLSMLDWLDEGHLAWFVIDAVELIDTTCFHEVHPKDSQGGRPAYDPEMMVALLLYAYCIGMRSSRQIEQSCRSDLAFRVICANEVPDHTTIARFRADNESAIASVFIEVLRLCDAAGLASLGTIAIDGTKIGSDAALDANHGSSWIRAEIESILADASDTDATEDAQGTLFDSILAAPLRRREGRLGRLRAALAKVEEAERAASETEAQRVRHAQAEAEAGHRPKGGLPKDPHRAAVRAELDLAATKVQADRHPERDDLARQVESAQSRLERATEATSSAGPATPAKIVANVTDPESAIMKAAQGWVQGYNVQAGVNEHQVVISYAATTDHNDVGQLLPMIGATQRCAATAGIQAKIGLVLADAGYWSEDNATNPGPDRLIATTKDWKQRKAARALGQTTGPAPDEASTLEAMEHRLRTPEGTVAYATRSHTVESVFGNAKENHGFRRFMRRGLVAAESETALIFATHNLMKIFHHNPSAVFAAS